MEELLTFEMPRVERVVQGPGARSAVGAELEERGLERALLVTGASLGASEPFRQFRDGLGASVAGTFDRIKAHNPVEQIIDLLHEARRVDADVLIAVGGGSPIDAAKLAALALGEGVRTTEDLSRFYVVFEYPNTVKINPLRGTPSPVFAIPTTLSAAEWDGFAGSVDHSRDTKDLTAYLGITPAAVFLDPELCAHTPRDLWATTGVRAVDHAVEMSYAKNAHPFTTWLAKGALAILAENLPHSVKDPSDYDAALKCQQAAWMSILGVHNVSLGLSHAIGHQLGALGIPHGVTSCIMLPHVMRFLEPVTAMEQAAIAEVLSQSQGGSENLSAADRVELLLDELGVPRRVSDFDIPRAKMDGVAHSTLGDIVVRESPRTVDEAAVYELLEKVW